MKDVFIPIPLGEQLSNKIANMGFICACLVVLMHSPVSDSDCLFVYYLKGILSMIAVPVFFIISGFLLARHCREDNWYKREVIKRVRTLLVPLWSLCILWFPIKYGLHHLGVLYFGADNSAQCMRLTVWNVLGGIGIIPWGHAVVVGMWYIKALFLMVVCSPFLFRLVRGSRQMAIWSIIVFAVATSVQNAVLQGWGGDEVFAYELNLRCPLYFIIGMALNLHVWQNAKGGRMNLVVAMLIAVASVVVADKLHQEAFALSCIKSLIRILATISMAFVVWHFVPSLKWPRFAAGNAFPVFVLHGMILYLMPLPFKAFGIWREVVGTLGPLPIAICTICLALATSIITRRFFPRFASIILVEGKL